MIEAIELQNFKCVRAPQRIDIRPLTLLFGPNSSGKSTVVDAIALMCNAVLGDSDGRWGFCGEEIDALSWTDSRNRDADGDAASVVRVDIRSPVLAGDDWNDVGSGVEECCERVGRHIGVGIRWGCDIWPVSSAVMEARIDEQTALVTVLPSEWPGDVSRPAVLDVNHPALRGLCPKNWREGSPSDRSQGSDGGAGVQAWHDNSAMRSAFGPNATLVDVIIHGRHRRAYRVPLRKRLPVGVEMRPGREDPPGYWWGHELVRQIESEVEAASDSFMGAELLRLLATDTPRHVARRCGSSTNAGYVGGHRRLGDVVVERGRGGKWIARNEQTNRPCASWIAKLSGDLAPIYMEVDGEVKTFRLSDPSISDRGLLVSKWCSDPRRLDLGVELKYDVSFELPANEVTRRALRDLEAGTLSDVMYSLGACGEPRFRLRVKSKDGAIRRLSEVGDGVGCVLPVVAAALTVPGPLYVEQPEIHLHPRVESRLADLFVFGLAYLPAREKFLSWNNGDPGVNHVAPCRIIETHSEHLVLRLLRRLREAAASQIAPEVAEWCDEIAAMSDASEARPAAGTWLRPEDLAVVCAEPTANGTVYRTMKVTKDGELVGRWPGGFFEERWEELK